MIATNAKREEPIDTWDTDKPLKSHAQLAPAICEALADVSRDGPIKYALDAGCGNGALCKEYAPRVRDLRAIDNSTSAVWAARRNLPTSLVHEGSVYDDLLGIFPDVPAYDVIVSADLIGYLYEPRTFLRNAFRALRPSGWLVLSTAYHGWAKNIATALANGFDRTFRPLEDRGPIKFWSPFTIRLLLGQSRFDVLSWRGVGRFPGLWDTMVIVAQRSRGA